MWWLLAAAALAAAAATFLLLRSRRAAAWRADLEAAEAEAAWFDRDLLPQLQGATTLDEVAGGWNVARGRVTAVEDELTRLEPSAPDEAGQTRARDLRDAVRAARTGVEGLVAARGATSWAPELGEIAAALAAALDRADAPPR